MYRSTKIFFVVCLLMGLTVALTPFVLSTGWGKEKMLAMVNSNIAGTLEVEKISISWLGKQKIEGLKLFDQKGESVLAFEAFETETPLVTLIKKGPVGAATRIDALNVKLARTPRGKTTLEEALGVSFPYTYSENEELSLEDVHLFCALPASPEHRLAFWAIGRTRQGNLTGNFSFSTQENSQQLSVAIEGAYLIDTIPIQGKCEATFHLPSDVVKLSEAFSCPLAIHLSLHEAPTETLDRVLNTNGWLASAFGKSITCSLHSEGMDAKEFHGSIASEKIRIPAFDVVFDQTIACSENDFTGTLSIPAMYVKEPSGQTLTLSLQAPWTIGKDFSSIAGEIAADVRFPSAPRGVLTSSYALKNLTSVENAEAKIVLEGKKIPAMLLDVLTGQDLAAALFGPSLDLKMAADIKNLHGSLGVNCFGTTGRCEVQGTIRNKCFYLAEPFKAEFTLTPLLCSQVLPRLSPLLAQLLPSDEPITLEISPKNFSFPLHPVTLASISFERAVLDVKRQSFANAGAVKDLLKAFSVGNSRVISIWATPIYASLNHGVLQISRFDFLAMDKFPLASWGEVDLTANQIRMTVGITGEALFQALGLGDVKPHAMVQVPIRGALSSPKIDSSKAAAKAGALIAENSTGAQGMVIGAILNIASGKEGKVPPPTTTPLPWEKTTTSPKEQQPAAKTKTQDPLKEIQKEASKFFKNLLR